MNFEPIKLCAKLNSFSHSNPMNSSIKLRTGFVDEFFSSAFSLLLLSFLPDLVVLFSIMII